MSDLPSRESVRPDGGGVGSWRAVIEAYVSRELKTEAERREAIDYQAASKALHELSSNDWTLEMDDGDTFDAACAIVDAAIGDSE